MLDLNDYLSEVENQIGYEFRNKGFLFQAFTRRSYSQENGGLNNEVLEFVGDRVLDFYVTKILMDKYGCVDENGEFYTKRFKTEGALTEIKKKLVNKKMLAHRIELMGFSNYLFMGEGDIKLNMQNEDSVREDLFEAILGAIALDSNWNQEKLEESVSLMLNIDYYLENGFGDDNDYVALLQQWSQKENGTIPVYEFKKSFYVDEYVACVQIDTPRGRRWYQGAFEKNKSQARYSAAMKAYYDLDEHDELFSLKDEINEEITLENSINLLQELAQKGYISMPEYHIDDSQRYDEYGNPLWGCKCYIRSEGIIETGYAPSKKTAKKYSAYLILCYLLKLNNQYR